MSFGIWLAAITSPGIIEALAFQGRLVQIAFLKGAQAEINLIAVMQRRLTITGSTLRPRSVEEKINCPGAAQGGLAADRERKNSTGRPRHLPARIGRGISPAYGNRFAHRQDRPGGQFVPRVNQNGPKSVINFQASTFRSTEWQPCGEGRRRWSSVNLFNRSVASIVHRRNSQGVFVQVFD